MTVIRDSPTEGDQPHDTAREADRYDALGRPDAAHRLRNRARILAAHVD